MMILTERQKTAVKYYEGDVIGNDPFWSDPKAYVTLNSLFYEGVGTERRRAMEGKKLNPAVLADEERLVSLCRDLLSCFQTSEKKNTFRVERYADFLEMKEAGCTISFTSTSSGGFLKEYGDRIGIALLEFVLEPGSLSLSFSQALAGEYLKNNEEEILLCPNLLLEFTEAELTDEECEIKDAEGKMPVCKYLVRVNGKKPVRKRKRAGSALSGMRVYEALNNGREPDWKDILEYTAWKEYFRAEVLGEE